MGMKLQDGSGVGEEAVLYENSAGILNYNAQELRLCILGYAVAESKRKKTSVYTIIKQLSPEGEEPSQSPNNEIVVLNKPDEEFFEETSPHQQQSILKAIRNEMKVLREEAEADQELRSKQYMAIFGLLAVIGLGCKNYMQTGNPLPELFVSPAYNLALTAILAVVTALHIMILLEKPILNGAIAAAEKRIIAKEQEEQMAVKPATS
jgi:hypothetical protein